MTVLADAAWAQGEPVERGRAGAFGGAASSRRTYPSSRRKYPAGSAAAGAGTGVRGTTSAGPATGPVGPGTDRWARLWLGFLVVAVFAVDVTFALARHATFRTTGFDLGIFDQAIRDYAHFRAPIVPLKGPDSNLLGDHFHPLIAVLAPLYWIWDDPRMLLIAQAGLFAVSIVTVTRFAARRFGTRTAWWIGLVYGISWPLQRAVEFDFHEIALAVPLIAVVIDALDRRRLRTVAICSLLLLGVREDLGAMVVLVGVLVALPGTGARFSGTPAGLRGHWDRRRVLGGLGLIVLGLAGYRFATGIVIPALAPTGAFAYWTFPALGPDLPAAARFVVTHPWQVLVLFVTPQMKAHTLLAMVTPTAFLALGSRYLLLAVPFVAERMLNSRSQLWDTGFHYTSVIAPILVMAAADTMHRLAPAFDHRIRAFPRLISQARRLVAGFGRPADREPVTAHPQQRFFTGQLGVRVGRAGAGLVVVWLVWCVGVIGHGLAVRSVDYPLSGLWSGTLWDSTERVRAIRETLPLIPPRQCVEADNQISPHLTSRNYVTQVTESHGMATWVLIDLSQEETGWEIPRPADALAWTLDAGYRLASLRGPIVVLHRDGPIDARCLVVP